MIIYLLLQYVSEQLQEICLGLEIELSMAALAEAKEEIPQPFSLILPWFSLCVQRTEGIHSMTHLGMSLCPSIVESTFRDQGKLTTLLNYA